jgi:hypothetical protein
MDRSILLYFLGVVVALIIVIILASQTENVYENPNTFLLGVAETITKL